MVARIEPYGWGDRPYLPGSARTAYGAARSPTQRGDMMMDKKGHGSETAKKANAKAAKDGKSNPRKSSAAQAELGKKGGKSR